MEIIVLKSNLVKSIGLTGSVSSNKTNTLPILSNILIETVDKNSIRLIGTDLEVGISTIIPAEVKREGSITIPAKKIQEIVRELSEGEIEISVAKNNAVSISTGKSFFKIMGLSKDDFPKLPEFQANEALVVEQSLVKECLSLTSFAISYDETRYVLNGVLMIVKNKEIKFVATDGRRLALQEKNLPEKAKKDFEMIIPTKAVNEITKILSWEGVVEIATVKNQMIFKIGETFVISRIIEGSFPNYQQVIPKGEKTVSQANRDKFLHAVRRTSLLTSADSPAIKLDFVKGKILISSKSPNLGEAKEELEAEVTGGDIAIGFNPNYLMDVLKNLDIDEVSFSLSDPDKPGLVKGKEGYQYVIMPMQLN